MLRQGTPPRLEDSERRRIRMIVHLELSLLLGIILCAVLMARGIGFIA
jgi:putative membrane protein